MQQEKDLYNVAVKVFLIDDSRQLLIIKDIYHDGWDIPGGRLREMDFSTDLGDVVKRKMIEELGSEIKYELGKPVVFMRHERDELLSSGEKEKRRIFAIGYEAKYLGGDMRLGHYIKEYKWVDLETFVPEDYLKGGWLKGVKEFQKYAKTS